ncbi:MAG TPA: ABC transporter substrate-binding protein [Solirubrobacterales bacterium]|nr:ABC transporter substrate-binding protein [Solirubrobacterales bacterium]
MGDQQMLKTPERPEKRPAELGSPRNLTVTLNGHEGPENVGILMALQRGYFRDAHLIVSVLLPFSPARPVHYVANGLDDLGVAQEPQVVLERTRGARVIGVGSLISQPTTALIWLKRSKIEGIGDLKGKTIAISGVPVHEDFLQSVLKRAGLMPGDVTIKSVSYNLVQELVSGRVDAIFGGSWNLEGADLEQRGLDPVIKPVHGLGVPAYDEFVVVASSKRLADEVGVVRDFMSAVIRGNVAAAKDPKAAVNAVLNANLGGPPQSRKQIEAEVAATVPLLSKNGYMNPEKASRLTDWMYEEGMIQRTPPVSKLLAGIYG